MAVASVFAVGSAVPSDRPPARPFVRGSLVTLNDNGGWCWFQGERAVVDGLRKLLVLSTVANGAVVGGAARHGTVDVVAHDIVTGATTRFPLHERLEADDHDSAALLVRPDGRYLAMYSRHHKDDLSRWRVTIQPGDVSAWEAERTFDNAAATTYSNLVRLARENGGRGRTYNFSRTVGFNPNFLTSADDGAAWAYGGRLLAGPGRPYVR
jgi:hypothetical protein